MINLEEYAETIHYVDSEGNYLGGFSEGNPAIPAGAIEVSTPPEHGWQKYNIPGLQWIPLTDDQMEMLGL